MNEIDHRVIFGHGGL